VTPSELREGPAERGNLRCYELGAWRERYGLVAGITRRDADFGLASPAPTGEVVARWLGFHGHVAPQFGAVVVARQCHGTDIAVHQAPAPGWRVLDATDGHLTPQPGLLLAITVADCVPIYLAQPSGPWLGLLHAGWRGVAQGMVEAGIAALTRRADCTPGEIVMHCGVSICGDCYEVGSEVISAVTGRQTQGPGLLDLRSEIAGRAAAAGVAHVSLSPWCTAHDQALFDSHRRSRGKDGRMVAYLGRPSA
jgi:purine-nucleoside/S-methyl-5'-thioadenosine phosphorylase / adenosine deaminase